MKEPFGWWDMFNECLWRNKEDADKAAAGGNYIIPLYEMPERTTDSTYAQLAGGERDSV